MKLFKVKTGFSEEIVLAENENKAKEIVALKSLCVFAENFKVFEIG